MRTVMETTRTSETIRLQRGDLIGLRQRHGFANVVVSAGRVWATCDQDPKDVILGAGQSAQFRGRGLVLIEALEDAEIVVRRGSGGLAAEIRRTL